jgi:hypothetical protein
MLFETPHLYEIEDMISFASKYKKIYIYGCAVNQEYLAKFLNSCKINVNGFITTHTDERPLCFSDLPKFTLDEADLTEAGIIVGLSEKYYDNVIPNLRKNNYNFFLLSEYTKMTIKRKLEPQPTDRIRIEINLVDHCNLNCQCCDHFSQLVKKPYFLDFEIFKKDMERLAELSNNHIDAIHLEGGEPLLHKDVNKFVELTRQLFPKAIIFFFTNGLLLLNSDKNPQGDFWKCCAENDVTLQLTQYPIKLDIEAIEKKANNYNVKLQIFGEVADRVRGQIKRSTKHPFNLDCNVPIYEYVSCYHFNKCIALRNGRLYTCPIIPYSNYFNDAFGKQLNHSDKNSIDIHTAENYDEIAEFVTRRVPFCGYCDIKHRRQLPWARSKKTLEEYVDI